MNEATDRPCPCPNDFAVGGFDILRPRLNVAAKLIRRLENEVAEQEQPVDDQKRPKGDESAGHFAAPRGAASVALTEPEMRAGVAYGVNSHGQASP